MLHSHSSLIKSMFSGASQPKRINKDLCLLSFVTLARHFTSLCLSFLSESGDSNISAYTPRGKGEFSRLTSTWRYHLSHQGSPVSTWSEVAQSCPTLCDPMDCSLPGSSVHGIFEARTLEWVAISFSRGSSWARDRTRVSHIVGRLFTVWATREALVCVYVTDSLSCTPKNNTQIVTLSEGESESYSVMSNSLRPHGLYSPWNSPGQNTGVGSLSLLQEIFPTQGSNPGLPHCGQILYQLSHQGSPSEYLVKVK